MEALDKIKDYKINDNVDSHIKYTLDEYKCYMNKLVQLPHFDKTRFLKTIETNEIVNNQEMEHEDPFMVQLDLASSNGAKRSSVDVMAESILYNQPLTIRKIEQLHRLLIRGSVDDIERNYRIRDFDVSVREVDGGIERISYIPPEPEEIRPYLKKMLSYLQESSEEEKNVFLNSILLHFYVAALQPFGNGNTRLGRLLEHGSIFKLTRDILGYKVKLPTIYMSKSHLITKDAYRRNIAKLVTEPTDENYNKWVNYNLNMIDEQLYYNNNVLDKMVRKR